MRARKVTLGTAACLVFACLSLIIIFSYIPFDKYVMKIDRHTGSRWSQRWVYGSFKVEDQIIDSPLRLHLQKLGNHQNYDWTRLYYTENTLTMNLRGGGTMPAMANFPLEFQTYWLETATEQEVLTFVHALPSLDRHGLDDWLTKAMDLAEERH